MILNDDDHKRKVLMRTVFNNHQVITEIMITPADRMLLKYINGRPRVSSLNVSRMFNIERSTAATKLAKLHAKGWLLRTDPKDGGGFQYRPAFDE
ncbi:MAG: hypothetical protein COB04_18740 [Gammaproteobacteria bacterium]|nr:MAG: hypothetical protein COB04_18740 [Gammaproteobacteria bacterium]